MQEQTVQFKAVGNEPLESPRLILERNAPKHVDYLHQLFQDPEFWNLYRINQNRKESLEKLEERLTRESELLPQQLKRIEWVIQRRDNNQAVGLIALAAYQKKHRRAEFLIGIRSSDDRTPGLGLEASLLVLDFAFNTIDLNKLTCIVYGHNKPAQQNALQLGFTQEGYFPQHIYNDIRDEFNDMYHNGMLAETFRSNHRLSKLSRRVLGKDITVKPATPEITVLDKAALKKINKQFQEAIKNNT